MEDNCWKTTARAAVSCLPPEADRGMLSADNATCAYPGGQVATFNPPIDLLGDDDPVRNFTITDANGARLRAVAGDRRHRFHADGQGKSDLQGDHVRFRHRRHLP